MIDLQMGMQKMTTAQLDYEALIIGTGFGGMGAAIQLKRMGINSILMLDRESDLGGTWHINRYPGLAVDIASVSYSYSFEPNPNWSRRYCPGEEIKSYADHVADKYDLRRHMQFNTTIVSAKYDEGGKFWTVQTDQGATYSARFLLLATGFLSQPQYPDIPGIDEFEGKIIHTAAWDYEYDLQGKRAAMIGTGASGVQVLPIIAEETAHMTVFQRTPIWVAPKSNPKITEKQKQRYARFPITQKIARFISDTALELMMVTALLNAKRFPFMMKAAQKGCLDHLHRQVKDPELRAKLTPDYDFGCKRPTFSNNYFPTFVKPNVDLVTDSIDRIEADGIVTKTGDKVAIDTLVLATGFNVWKKGNFPAFDVVGKGNQELGDRWLAEGFQSFEGITVPGFPNLFNLHSPFSYSGFCYFNTIEIQMKHMERCLKEYQRRGAESFEATEDAQQKFIEKMRRKGDDTVFAVGSCNSANSYYFDPHGQFSLLRLSSARNGMASARHFPLNAYRFA